MKEDWIECDAKFLGKLIRGINYKKTQSSDKPEDGYLPIFRGNNILDNQLNFENLKYVQKDLIKTEQKILEDDIIFAMSSGSKHLVGKSAQAKKDFEGSFGAFCAVFRPNKIISSSFIQAYFHSSTFRRMISNASKGSNINNLKREHILEAIVPLPPLIEQKAIVNKIEELFSSLDSGIADLKKAQEQLKIYRQAVLKKAFEGRWEKVQLGDVCEKVSKVKRKEMPINKSLKYLDIGGIDNNINKIISYKEYTWENAPSRAQQIIKVGDVLFSTVRTYLKNIARVEKSIFENEIASSGFTVIRGKRDILDSKFIFFITTSQFFLEPLSKLQRGTSYPAVRDSDVFAQIIPLPPLKEQHQIVQEIESRLSVCDKVEENITISLEKAQALRQSILKKAFEGKLLTEEEIAKCKAHPDYEPASVLLEKIKTEKKK